MRKLQGMPGRDIARRERDQWRVRRRCVETVIQQRGAEDSRPQIREGSEADLARDMPVVEQSELSLERGHAIGHSTGAVAVRRGRIDTGGARLQLLGNRRQHVVANGVQFALIYFWVEALDRG